MIELSQWRIICAAMISPLFVADNHFDNFFEPSALYGVHRTLSVSKRDTETYPMKQVLVRNRQNCQQTSAYLTRSWIGDAYEYPTGLTGTGKHSIIVLMSKEWGFRWL